LSERAFYRAAARAATFAPRAGTDGTMLPAVALLVLHRILIATLIAFCGYFVWHEARTWQRDGSGTALLLAVVFGVVAVAATWYLTNLRRFVRIEPPERRES